MEMKPIIKLHRFWQDEFQTSGTLTILDTNNFPLFSSLSLERGWRNNEKNISCIPTGVYEVHLEYSPLFQQLLWEIKGVPGRSECKFHSANYWNELNGCISPGLRYKKLNNDEYRDVTNSRASLSAFHKALGTHKTAILIITGEPTIK
jgi:hypothetical protein